MVGQRQWLHDGSQDRPEFVAQLVERSRHADDRGQPVHLHQQRRQRQPVLSLAQTVAAASISVAFIARMGRSSQCQKSNHENRHIVQHAFKWQNGVLSDVGTLPGGSSSFALWINNGGQTVGVSQNGLIDPLTGAPASIAVLWKSNGEIINLGTLGGNESLAVALNDRSQAV